MKTLFALVVLILFGGSALAQQGFTPAEADTLPIPSDILRSIDISSLPVGGEMILGSKDNKPAPSWSRFSEQDLVYKGYARNATTTVTDSKSRQDAIRPLVISGQRVYVHCTEPWAGWMADAYPKGHATGRPTHWVKSYIRAGDAAYCLPNPYWIIRIRRDSHGQGFLQLEEQFQPTNHADCVNDLRGGLLPFIRRREWPIRVPVVTRNSPPLPPVVLREYYLFVDHPAPICVPQQRTVVTALGYGEVQTNKATYTSNELVVGGIYQWSNGCIMTTLGDCIGNPPTLTNPSSPPNSPPVTIPPDAPPHGPNDPASGTGGSNFLLANFGSHLFGQALLPIGGGSLSFFVQKSTDIRCSQSLKTLDKNAKLW